MRNISMDWLALVASGIVIFMFGVIVGMWLLRRIVQHDLRQSGQVLRWRVDSNDANIVHVNPGVIIDEREKK